MKNGKQKIQPNKNKNKNTRKNKNKQTNKQTNKQQITKGTMIRG